MRHVCAWCTKELEDIADDDGGLNAEVSHGICKSCREHFFSSPSRTLDGFLNKIKEPVLVIDDEARVTLANNAAQTMLGKDLNSIAGHRGGDVMECAYARLPQGCGNTIHCLGCTIRNNVMLTFDSGRSLKRVPAILNRLERDGIYPIHFLVSTELLGDVVLLRIDEQLSDDPVAMDLSPDLAPL